MTEQVDRRSDGTRLQILRAASRLFARSPYSRVSLDDILADAEVTKGAMYFHFRSKHALALAIISLRVEEATDAVAEVLHRRMSGLETVIDLSYVIAVDDITDDTARASLNLIESIGRTEGLQLQVLSGWVDAYRRVIERGVAEGDITDRQPPEAIARLLVSTYMGLRQASDLDDPQRFLHDLQSAWLLLLPGLATPDRMTFLTEFIKRRTTVAVRRAARARADRAGTS
ncbi:transcriptional regulator [Mycolicibacterium phlei]|uniref:TetR family transcriptional regulator n=1 Tax=Mycolicibacterium phlei DSM 43239 = CCUG 21000 TaxID=1226750 RepID=A0A5N5UPZ9_MYCPH|nr:TetR/AcrR family transcriptional regulator [Mycolicibacterium phlei]VEG08817.1 transcriptional regulator [Mycobacteroides chelonae]AMO60699.1 A-factor receptor protein [Mycolicibacterium phlei]EID14897.1 TetR family transcriptional regulator [Mycolicibacterium phlei RIVM601174]KAB7751428.1 TetR family transcriptional regulator [Mycolicibacterium phlei DSM 43239 = CCUG 21000]KXW68069.1 TetR family transcriptional regulator [Mycolicibacterium phlei DSM 43239 = CCUG 21000]